VPDRSLKVNTSNLESLGCDNWFSEQASIHCDATSHVARVAAADRDQLLLINETGSFRVKLSGKYLYETVTAVELPCVGGWVCVERSATYAEKRQKDKAFGKFLKTAKKDFRKR